MELYLHTTLFVIKGSNNKKQTKQRKSSKIKHCKISQKTTHNTRPDIQHTVENDIIGYGELAQKIRFSNLCTPKAAEN